MNALGTLARFGRYALVVGLLAGLLLPNVALALKPWLPHLIVLLLSLTALRIGPDDARHGLSNLRATLATVLCFQLVCPLFLLLLAFALGWADTPYVLAIVLVLAAPALSGSPNLAILVGADPEPAFRLLILGTAMLPLTMLPVFWLLPELGDLSTAVFGASRILGALIVAVSVGFLIRKYFLNSPTTQQSDAIDGAMTLALVVIVIGLMSALRPALSAQPADVAIWLLVAVIVNLGMQLGTFYATRNANFSANIVPLSIVAGNRNVAIFLVALPTQAAEPLLIFLGCYQIPMYLTPIIMRRIYVRS